MKKICRVGALLLGVLLLATALTACSASRKVYASPRAYKVVATAGEMEIYYDELYFLAMNYADELKAEHGEGALSDPDLLAELEGYVWENLLTREVALRAIGYEYGLDVTKGEIADNVQLYMDKVVESEFSGDRKAYIQSLAERHMTDRYARVYFGVQDYLATEIVLEMLQRGELDDSDDAARELIESKDFIHTKHVFIKKNNGMYSEEDNLQHITELWQSVATRTTPEGRYEAMEEALRSRYNLEFDTMGEGFYFTRGEMNETYEDAAFGLDAHYDVSDVFETEDGYYFVMLLPKDETYIEKNFQALKEKPYFIYLNDKVDEWLAENELVKTSFGEGLDLANLPEINPRGGSTLITVGVIVGTVLVVVAVAFLTVKFSKKKGDTKGKKKKGKRK